jgi:Pre-toxin TG
LKTRFGQWLFGLRRYEEKLNEAEELLYRTAAAMRQADQTLADNMIEFGLELLGWYDLQRLFGEYDPITGERISVGDGWLAGGMLLLSVIPPAKGAGVAGKAGSKGEKAAGTAVDVSKLVSQTKHVLRYDKIMTVLQAVYRQVVKAPITQTIRSFKKQWENLLENVGSVLQGPQPALAGIGPARGVWMSEAERKAKETMMNIIGKTDDEMVGKGKWQYKEFQNKHRG